MGDFSRFDKERTLAAIFHSATGRSYLERAIMPSHYHLSTTHPKVTKSRRGWAGRLISKYGERLTRWIISLADRWFSVIKFKYRLHDVK
jgi:hypothetical protein